MFPISTRRVLSNAGIHVYGLGAIALGLVGLVWGDFAAVWQPVPATTPHRAALAYITAVLLLVGGAAVLGRRTAQAGVVVLAILYFIFALLWLPRVVGYPQIFATWGGFLELFSVVTAALVVYACLAQGDSAWADRTARIGRFLYGVCVLSFALDHFFALKETAKMVPAWIPPGQQFWAVGTGIFHLLAGIAILSGVLDVLASRLLTAMLIAFGALIWAPALFATPHEHFVWAANAINLALAGAAWVIADYVANGHEQLQSQPDSGGGRRRDIAARPDDVTV
jgi:uncharacterized membrane protein YphA (DoxX/SURF4 family)